MIAREVIHKAWLEEAVTAFIVFALTSSFKLTLLKLLLILLSCVNGLTKHAGRLSVAIEMGIESDQRARILDILKDGLKKGEAIKIAGFGNFVVRSKRERKGRNPRTGEEIAITPRRVVTFRPSQLFKKYVNS